MSHGLINGCFVLASLLSIVSFSMGDLLQRQLQTR
jgi:hypothetical protein